MALFDYSYVESARPYHSNFDIPDHIEKAIKKQRRFSNVMNTLQGVASGVIGSIPLVGSAANAIGMPIAEASQASFEGKINKQIQEALDPYYQTYLDQLPDNITATQQPIVSVGGDAGQLAGGLAKAAVTAGAGIYDALKKPKPTDTTTQPDNSFFKNMGINVDLEPTQQDSPNDFPTDNTSTGTTVETVGSGTFMNYEDGGKIVIGGNGEDDIALIDTTTGKDTGVRVAGNELIVSEDNLMALKEAIGKGNKKKVFDIISTQIDEVPVAEQGAVGLQTGAEIKAALEKAQKALENEKAKAEGREAEKDYDAKLKRVKYLMEQLEKGDGGKGAMGATGGYLMNPQTTQDIIKELEGLNQELYGTVAPTPTQVMTPPIAAPKRTGAGGIKRTVGEEIDFEMIGYPKTDITSVNATEPSLAPALTEPVGTEMVNIEETNPYKLGGSDYLDLATSGLGYGFDAWRLSQGMKGAKQPLPRWSVPARFTNYLDRLESMSTRGLSAAEMAALQSEADRTYAYDVDNIYNLSGGNAGTALGNLGRASSTRNINALNIASLDRQAEMQNLQNYGGAVAQDVNLDRMQFGDIYNEAVMNKQGASQLASDAMTNIMERFNTDRFYGVGSEAWKTKKMQQEFLKENLDIKKGQRRSFANMNWLPSAGTQTDAQFSANAEPTYTYSQLKALGLIK